MKGRNSFLRFQKPMKDPWTSPWDSIHGRQVTCCGDCARRLWISLGYWEHLAFVLSPPARPNREVNGSLISIRLASVQVANMLNSGIISLSPRPQMPQWTAWNGFFLHVLTLSLSDTYWHRWQSALTLDVIVKCCGNSLIFKSENTLTVCCCYFNALYGGLNKTMDIV